VFFSITVVVDTIPFWRLEEENNGSVKLQRVIIMGE
jgi:hypothetical protein